MIKITKNEVLNEQLGFILVSFIINIIIVLIMLFFNQPKSIISGILTGYVISIINHLLLYITLQAAVKLGDSEKAKKYVIIRYFIRYIMLALMLYIAFTSEKVNILTFLVGFSVLKVVIYIMTIKQTYTGGEETWK